MKTIKDMDIDNKKVILRCDFNVPIDNDAIKDDSKIKKSLKTINYLLTKNCKIIILSHFGRIKTEEDKEKNSLMPVYNYLSEIYEDKISFSEDLKSPALIQKVNAMQSGEIILLENTRFMDLPEKLESKNDLELAQYWASLADIFCLDAFGSSHRAHASTAGIAKFIPSCIGFLVEEELSVLKTLTTNPKKPFTVVMGGSKIDDKILLMESLLKKCDYLLIGGGIANTFLKVLNFNVGSSIVSKDQNILNAVRTLLLNYKEKIILPLDFIVTNNYDQNYVKTKNVNNIDINDIIYDIGPKTLKKFNQAIELSNTIFLNGTVGLYEDPRFSNGTREILNLLANSKAKVVVGGGDGVSAVKSFGFESDFAYLSSGGGATLDYICDGKLDAIDAIEEGVYIETLDV